MYEQFIDDWNETRSEEVDPEDTFESIQRSTKRGDRLHKTKTKKSRDYKNCEHWRKGGYQSGDWTRDPDTDRLVWNPDYHRVHTPHRSVYKGVLKRLSNRLIRRMKMKTDWTTKGEHHKAFDFWWELD